MKVVEGSLLQLTAEAVITVCGVGRQGGRDLGNRVHRTDAKG